MARVPALALAALVVAGCAPAWHPQPAEPHTFTPEFRQTDFRIRIHVLPASQIDRIRKVVDRKGRLHRVFGAAVPDPRAGACDIWIPRPVPLPGRLNDALTVAGHELWHCIVGRWHGLPDGVRSESLPPEFISELRGCISQTTLGVPHPRACSSVVSFSIKQGEKNEQKN